MKCFQSSFSCLVEKKKLPSASSQQPSGAQPTISPFLRHTFQIPSFTREKVCQWDRGERSRSALLQNKLQEAFIKASARLCLLTATRSLHQSHARMRCDLRLAPPSIQMDIKVVARKGRGRRWLWDGERLKRFPRHTRERMLCVCMMEAVSKHLSLLHHNSI